MNIKPAIVSPVARSIGVADTARSIAFYRDVLGFDVREQAGMKEVVYGPARIQFDSKQPRSAMLFFETDDVEALHAVIRTRGGNPSELEKVNWIKMRMFAVHDPDQHVLWFGQSYNVPDSPVPTRMLEKALPALPLDDVAAGVAYYRDVLGFKINYQQHDLGVMDRDAVTLLLVARTEKHKGIGSCYLYVENADALYEELRAKGANLQGEPVSRPWGLREFRILDPEGNDIGFGQPFE
jgi:catechol 2,3-dioxygenase-like lactoylglutathione lyase family enzyme